MNSKSSQANFNETYRLENLKVFLITILFLAVCYPSYIPAKELEGTKALIWKGDIASKLIDNVDTFLLNKIEESVQIRNALSKKPDKEKLKEIIGVRDQRIENPKIFLSKILSIEPEYSIRLFKIHSARSTSPAPARGVAETEVTETEVAETEVAEA